MQVNQKKKIQGFFKANIISLKDITIYFLSGIIETNKKNI